MFRGLAFFRHFIIGLALGLPADWWKPQESPFDTYEITHILSEIAWEKGFDPIVFPTGVDGVYNYAIKGGF